MNNIKLNQVSDSFHSFLPSFDDRFKPIVYIVSAIAISILIYQGLRYVQSCLSQRSWRLQDPSLKEIGFMEEIPEKELSKAQHTDISFRQLVDFSNVFAFRIPFDTTNNKIKTVATNAQIQAEVVAHAKATHPVLPARIWSFIPRFIDYKKQFGSSIEKELYQDMTPMQFVDRLIKKRPLAFWNPQDSFLLRNGEYGVGGFENIGTDNEQKNLCLKDYQSYFEMSLATFLSVFVPTHFINNGNRLNKGKPAPVGTYEPKGIYVGMVGARFEKLGLMEWAHMIVMPEQNTAENGYGRLADPANPKTIELRLWAELYNNRLDDVFAFPDYEEVKNDKTGRYLPIEDGFLDTVIYKERLKLSIESFLLESNERAREQGKKAYLHIVGLGLGVWMVHDQQTDLMLEVYSDLLHKHQLDHISDLNFSWFNGAKECGGVADQGIFDSNGHPIKIHFSQREPAEKLTGEDEGKLLIAQYAWDSNSYPGNEYWMGALSASGDPAAACCSMIMELQNPEINPNMQAKYLTIVPALKG